MKTAVKKVLYFKTLKPLAVIEKLCKGRNLEFSGIEMKNRS